MRHDVRQPVVVIPFHPHHFNLPLGIGQLPDVSQKLPVIFGQAGEIEIGEDVAQQNQPLKAVFLQHARSLARMTRLCTQVQVGKDQRVVHVQIHIPVLAVECYGLMKCASILVHMVTPVVTDFIAQIGPAENPVGTAALGRPAEQSSAASPLPCRTPRSQPKRCCRSAQSESGSRQGTSD